MLSRYSYLETAAVKKRVLYTDTSVIYEGMPLCYDYDSTTNIDGYDIVDGEGATTDESHQNEGKYVRVTDPEDNALMHFAGVVAGVDKQGNVQKYGGTEIAATGGIAIANTRWGNRSMGNGGLVS